MQAASVAHNRGGPLGLGATSVPPPRSASRASAPRRVARIPCGSVARDVDAEPSVNGREAASAAPSSWPSAAARRAAYSGTDRAAALDVPAEVSGRLPAWLNGSYIRNGPGDLLASVRKGRRAEVGSWMIGQMLTGRAWVGHEHDLAL